MSCRHFMGPYGVESWTSIHLKSIVRTLLHHLCLYKTTAFEGLLVNWLCSYPRKWALQLYYRIRTYNKVFVWSKWSNANNWIPSMDIRYVCPYLFIDGIIILIFWHCVANRWVAKSLYNCMLFNNFFLFGTLMKAPIKYELLHTWCFYLMN